MKIVTLSSDQFDNYASAHRYRNYYQSSAYGNLMIKFGYNAHYLGIINEQNKLIGASLILYKTVWMGKKIAYAPRGIPLTVRDNTGTIMNFNNKGNTIIDNLKSAGYEYKGKNLFFETEKPRWEALVLLNRDIREIFAKFDKRTRNKIRRATNSGVEVIKDESKNVTKLYEFIGKKEKKPLSYYKAIINDFGDNVDLYYAKINTETFVINSRRTYEKEMEDNDLLANKVQDITLDDKERESFLNKKMESDKLMTSYKNSLLTSTELLKNNPNGIIIAGIMVINYDNAAYIFAEGIDEEYSYLNANYLVKWRMIDDYNNKGYKYLNLNGVVGEFEKENEYSGLNESKLGFNSTITEYIGEFDIVLNKFNFNMFEKFNKKKK